jgi:hypothetical protein
MSAAIMRLNAQEMEEIRRRRAGRDLNIKPRTTKAAAVEHLRLQLLGWFRSR